MKGQKVLWSSKSDEWATPPSLLTELQNEFGILCDPCPINHKLDGLKEDWENKMFVNPPYSNIKGWLEKGIKELELKHSYLIVYLLPARVDTKWFHSHIYKNPNCEIRFIKGRLKFNGHKNSAPFPSMICIFK